MHVVDFNNLLTHLTTREHRLIGGSNSLMMHMNDAKDSGVDEERGHYSGVDDEGGRRS